MGHNTNGGRCPYCIELASERAAAGRWRAQAQEAVILLAAAQAELGGEVGYLNDLPRRLRAKIDALKAETSRLREELEKHES